MKPLRNRLALFIPAALAASLLPLTPATAAEKQPLKVCLVSGSAEYRSDASLAKLQEILEKNYPIQCERAFGRDKGDDLPGLEALETGDLMVLFTRRLTLPEEQLARIEKWVAAGKPIVAIRTASHAFQNWKPDTAAFDREVLGGNYKGHYEEALAHVRIEAKDHPVLTGVKPFTTRGKLYKNPDLAKDATVLLTAATPRYSEPVAWVRNHKGGRVFYTSLGVPEDFEDGQLQRLLINAIFWAAQRPVPDK